MSSIWIVLLVVLFLIILYLLSAPLFVDIDTKKGLFRFRYHFIASACIRELEYSLWLIIRIGFWEKKYDLLNSIKAERKQKKGKKIRKRTRSAKRKIRLKTLRKIKAALSTFQIKSFVLDIDTGNPSLNASLLPLFYWLKLIYKKDMSINFFGENLFILKIQNSIGRMLWAYLRS